MTIGKPTVPVVYNARSIDVVICIKGELVHRVSIKEKVMQEFRTMCWGDVLVDHLSKFFSITYPLGIFVFPIFSN
jgi:hypothetical protein